MRHASFPAIGFSASAPSFFRGKRRQRRLFTLILDALHRSRRLQAQRILQQYRHLVARTGTAEGHAKHQDIGVL
jgi:hypothetical protein